MSAPTITAPGAYDGIQNAVYHSKDCTPTPALSASGAKLLVTECPALFRHLYLSNAEREAKAAFDIGTAAHLMMLEPEKFAAGVRVIDADDYRSKAAKDARDEARAAGLTPLLRADAERMQAMRETLLAHPVAKHAFVGGVAERSLFWKDAEFGIWCKCRPDYLPTTARYLTDYKTSSTANPEKFARAAYDFGYHQQAAWYLDGVEAVTGERPERFAFIVQAKEPPFLVSVCWLDAEAVEWGRILNRRAMSVFARCLERDEWPGYRADLTTDAAFTIGLPSYAKRDLEKRHESGAFADLPA